MHVFPFGDVHLFWVSRACVSVLGSECGASDSCVSRIAVDTTICYVYERSRAEKTLPSDAGSYIDYIPVDFFKYLYRGLQIMLRRSM